MKKILIACLSMAVFSACGNDEATQKAEAPTETTAKERKLDKLSWFLGTWEMVTPDGVFTEHWEKTNDSIYTGSGMMLSPKGDTLFSEHIILQESNNMVYYKPVVSDQNEGKEVVFTEKTWGANEIVFEDPTHDFPQRIIYKKPSDSTLYARIEGVQNGKNRQEEYQYKRK